MIKIFENINHKKGGCCCFFESVDLCGVCIFFRGRGEVAKPQMKVHLVGLFKDEVEDGLLSVLGPHSPVCRCLVSIAINFAK